MATARPRPAASLPANDAIALSVLAQALRAEERRGFDDGAVKGGLDRLLVRLYRERRLPPGSALTRAVGDLAQTSYQSLTPTGRAGWVRTLSGLLRREREGPAPGGTAATAARRPEPIRTGGAERAIATPVKPAAPHRTSPAGAKRSLDEPVGVLRSVNTAVAAKLKTLGVVTIRDLLYHFPHRYDDFSRFRPIAQLVPGEQQTLIASVWSAAEKQLGRRRKATELIVGDHTGNLRVVFFNQPYLSSRFKTGATIVLSGRVSVFQHQRQMDSPEWELLDTVELQQALHTGRLVPVYPLTAGLGARTVRRATHEALDTADQVEESLPAMVLERNRLMPLPDAIRQVHYPDSESRAVGARRRLAFEELLALQLAVLDERKQRQQAGYALPLPLDEQMQRAFLASLPFALTGAQARVSAGARGRPRKLSPNGAPAAGRRGQRQDRRRCPGAARGRQPGYAGGADGANGDSGRTALSDPLPALRRQPRFDRSELPSRPRVPRAPAPAWTSLRRLERPRQGGRTGSARSR